MNVQDTNSLAAMYCMPHCKRLLSLKCVAWCEIQPEARIPRVTPTLSSQFMTQHTAQTKMKS